MARLPRLAKGQGKFGFSQEELARGRKNNEVFAANLTEGLRGFGRRALASYAASVLEGAMEVTLHDSSRFAANWRLTFNRDTYTKDWKPEKYADTDEGGAEIGTRGTLGRKRNAILASKRAYYGYRVTGKSVEVAPDGMLGSKIGLTGQVGRPSGGFRGLFQLGAIPRVELFNAILAGDKRGVHYAKNALKEDFAEIDKKAKDKLGLDSLRPMFESEIRKARNLPK